MNKESSMSLADKIVVGFAIAAVCLVAGIVFAGVGGLIHYATAKARYMEQCVPNTPARRCEELWEYVVQRHR